MFETRETVTTFITSAPPLRMTRPQIPRLHSARQFRCDRHDNTVAIGMTILALHKKFRKEDNFIAYCFFESQ